LHNNRRWALVSRRWSLVACAWSLVSRRWLLVGRIAGELKAQSENAGIHRRRASCGPENHSVKFKSHWLIG